MTVFTTAYTFVPPNNPKYNAQRKKSDCLDYLFMNREDL